MANLEDIAMADIEEIGEEIIPRGTIEEAYKDTSLAGPQISIIGQEPENRAKSILGKAKKPRSTDKELRNGQCQYMLGAGIRCLKPVHGETTRCILHPSRQSSIFEEKHVNKRPPVDYTKDLEFRLPARLGTTAKRVINHPGLLSLRRHIAVLEAIFQDNARMIDNTPGYKSWAALSKAYKTYKRSVGTRDESAARHDLESQLESGLTTQEAQKTVRELAQEIAKLSSLEVVRLDKMGQFITKYQALEMVQGIIDAVNEVIKEPSTRELLAERIADIASRSGNCGDNETGD